MRSKKIRNSRRVRKTRNSKSKRRTMRRRTRRTGTRRTRRTGTRKTGTRRTGTRRQRWGGSPRVPQFTFRDADHATTLLDQGSSLTTTPDTFNFRPAAQARLPARPVISKMSINRPRHGPRPQEGKHSLKIDTWRAHIAAQNAAERAAA